MPAQGGSTAQSGFVLQNSIAALKLAELLDIPNQKASIYITSVIVEALGDLIFVDDIVVRYKEHDRHWTHWIQVKEDIDRKGEAWSKLWIDITRQKENNLSDFDRIVIYIGTKNKFFEELQETCKRAEGKKTWEEWKPTGSMEKVIASIRESIFKYYQDEDNKNKLERLPSLEKINDNFILEMIARVDIEILTLDEILDKNNRLHKKMPKCNVPVITLFRILRDLASEHARYNIPFDEINLRYKLQQHDIEVYTVNRPREEYEPETIVIDDGESFLIGDDSFEHEKPQWKTKLPGYRIGKYPVTNNEFAKYVDENKGFNTNNIGWIGNTPPEGMERIPVRGVTFFEAIDYCRWLSQKSGRMYRLPTEAEWEKAARGNDGRHYPWGNQWEENRCNAGGGQPAEVDEYEQGIYRCYDLVGNVPEWTCSLWGGEYDEPDEKYRHPENYDDRNDIYTSKYVRRVIRGGSYKTPCEGLRCSARGRDLPENRGLDHRRYGFRVVLEIDQIG